MKSNIIASFILMAFASSGAVAAEKVTYEKAMQSHKETYGKYAEQSVTEAQSQKSWDDHIQKPEQNKDGNATISRSYTQIWQSSTTSGLNTGNITLSESFRNFDEIITIGSNDNGQYVQQYRFTPSEYDLAISLGAGTATLYERDSVSWSGKFTTPTYFTTTLENAKLYYIYGVKFTSASGSQSCKAGEFQVENIYCNSPQKTCEVGVKQKTCSSNNDWTSWSTTKNPICVSQTQQCP
jgi:hypothetical protein